MDKKVTVAAVQASPIFPLNGSATVEKACHLIKEAAHNGAQFVVLPETFIPAYPSFSVNLDNPNQWAQNLALFQQESIKLNGPEIAKLRSIARAESVTVCLGFNESVEIYEGQFFNSLVFIGANGEILGHHRKLLPSNRERCFWGRGDGSSLRVYNSAVGRIGGLICYEHLQPLLKYALISQGEQIHCACWPGWPHFKEGRSNRNIIDIANRMYAIEGQCFVVLASMYVPKDMAKKAGIKEFNWDYFGGSGIINPLGEYIAGPIYEEESIVYADINLKEILLRKVIVDTAGRDHRWDVIRLDYRPFSYQPFTKTTLLSTQEPKESFHETAVDIANNEMREKKTNEEKSDEA